MDLGARERAEAFIRALAGSIPFAPSLGDVQTTLSHPATTSHRGQDAAAMARQGIGAGMVRLSVGLEDPRDLWRRVPARPSMSSGRRLEDSRVALQIPLQIDPGHRASHDDPAERPD